MSDEVILCPKCGVVIGTATSTVTSYRERLTLFHDCGQDGDGAGVPAVPELPAPADAQAASLDPSEW